MAELTEGRYRGEFLYSEACGTRSLETVTIDTGDLAAGTVLGKIATTTPTTGTAGANTGNGTMTAVTGGADAKVGTYTVTCTAAGVSTAGAATGAAVGGNTGNGTITASPTVGAGAKVGVYRAICIEPATDLGKFVISDPDGIEVGVATVATQFVGGGLTFTIADGSTDFVSGDSFTITVAAVAANGGTFSVIDPDGNRLKDAGIGAYTSSQINFTINDGTTDFIVGDSFTIAVAAGSGKYVILAPAATNGSQIAAGILYDNVDATSADVEAAVYVRDCEVNGSEITWPAGITDDQKTAAIAQLAALGVIVR